MLFGGSDCLADHGRLAAGLSSIIDVRNGLLVDGLHLGCGGGFLRGILLASGFVSGDAIGNLTVEHARQGAFSGTIKLTSAQLAALKREALYVRIDSEKSPDGNVQGWLEDAGKDHVS